MKKSIVILLASMGLMLCGCGSPTEFEELNNENSAAFSASEIQAESGSEADTFKTQIESVETVDSENPNAGITDVTQGGPYGTISISLPAGWNYEAYPKELSQ